MAETREDVRRIIGGLARTVDRRLAVEVRELPGQERLQLILTHGSHHAHIETPIATVLAAAESAVERNDLRLRLKRAMDTMLFRPMPDHRMTVKPVPPPGGGAPFRSPRGRGR